MIRLPNAQIIETIHYVARVRTVQHVFGRDCPDGLMCLLVTDHEDGR